MADDAPDASPKNEPLNVETKEDAETRATRRELKQSSISDPPTSGAEDAANTSDAPDKDMKEQIASPKKKRAHDQLEGSKGEEENDTNSVTSSDSAKDRSLRLEPEKKRHRDEETDLTSAAASSQEATKDSQTGNSPTKKSQPQTSASAFAASGFGKLSSGSSPFASLGATQGSSPFASAATGKPSLSSFASPTASTAAQPAAAPKLTFGSSGGASPFAGLSATNGSPFGGTAFGSAFGTGKPLSSFAAPGAEPPKSEKPSKPFGAPDSDVEEDDDEDGEGEETEQPDETERAASPEKESDEKKKLKLQKIEVNDGEAGEATVVSVRAKMFYHDKEAGWKERGAGMLKINVPQACVEYDDNGAVIPGSFDASALEVDEEAAGGSQGHKVARLIMRQDQTHRVILNTALVAAMKFQEKASLKSVGILFTAFEGEQSKPVSITMRMSAANAKIFMNEIGIIQRELQSSSADSGTADKSLSSSHQGKRKRDVQDDAVVGSPTSSQSSDSKVTRGGKKGKGRPSLKKEASSVVIPCVVEWPEELKRIERTHRALNLVYTFCTTRKHLATTFDTIKSAVEGHIKRELLVDEVASMVALRPEGIYFAYVDETMLQLDVKGTERDEVFRTGKSFRSQAPAHDASVGGYTGLESLDKHHDRDLEPMGREVLFLEFIDGDLKRQVQGKGGEPTKPNRKLRDEQLKMPVYSQKQMTNLIERRNQKFTNAINIFLNKCIEAELDPLETLKEQTKSYIPVPSAQEEFPPEKAAESIPESIPKERKTVTEIVQELKESPWYTGQIVPDGHRVFEQQEPVYGDLNFLLSQDLVNALYNAKGITQFYAHQSEALNSLHDGKHVVVSTSTSSGKSLIYQLPVIRALEEDYNSRAMYIFPTKALAQDQKRSLKDMIGYMPGLEETMIETFDGDTPMTQRNDIREQARVIFTNPDMLHITILPQEERWRSYLKNLKYVVVDELHYYNGQMGSHMSFIMRRLRRICAAVGNRRVKFISCSATVANPEQHFRTIFGIDNVQLIDYDGSPSGRKEFLCWNTPYKDPGDPASGRGSTKFECARLFCALMLRGVRIIAFCRVRAQCELLVSTIKQELESLGRPECTNLVMGYRGGYTAQDRRRIETEMFQGQLLGIVATTALELGIDIGSLDCVMTWGFPYTIANLRQQSGRAGRRNKDSLSILVGDGFATDQHYMQNPDELFTKPNCELQVDLENMLVREGHIQCAAYEMPIRPEEDAKYFGRDLPKVCAERLIRDDMGFYHCHDRFRPIPAKYVAIRDTEDDHFAIVDITNGRNIVLEELEASRATFTLYDGAIFLHQGNPYLVRDFQPDKGMARVERVKVEWTTVQRDYTDIDPTETEAIRTISDSRSHAYYGTIKIQQNVFGFWKVDKKNRVLDAVQVDNPPVIRFSKGMWLDVPKKAMSILQERRLHIAAAIHAAEHAMMSLLPAFVISMPGDVRTECKTAVKEFAKQESQRKRPARLTFYDAKGGVGGSGISTKAFDHVDQLLRDALKRVENCHCERGCVECVASEQCKQANEVMSKAGSQVILKTLLNVEVDVDSLPMGPELNIPMGTETVVLAEPVPYRAKEVVFESGISNRPVELEECEDSAKSGDSGKTDGGGGFEQWLADSI
ncbi:dead deah box helicase [Fusarium longipes]|uniref:Dead deah box helicase n=1 Tax=Fusarium longipes TaxID=694270 RepID=A0A395S7E5_9HYPO|nr:dead deah box helicase [Fusarium longipes]